MTARAQGSPPRKGEGPVQGAPSTALATTFTGEDTSPAGRAQGFNACRRHAGQPGPVYPPAPGTEAALDLARAWGRA